MKKLYTSISVVVMAMMIFMGAMLANGVDTKLALAVAGPDSEVWHFVVWLLNLDTTALSVVKIVVLGVLWGLLIWGFGKDLGWFWFWKDMVNFFKLMQATPIYRFRIRYSEEDFRRFVKSTIERNMPIEDRRLFASHGTRIKLFVEDIESAVAYWKLVAYSPYTGQITIDAHINPVELANTVIHELAHARTTYVSNGDFHGEAWQKYNKIFGGVDKVCSSYRKVRWDVLPYCAMLTIVFKEGGEIELLSTRTQLQVAF